MITQIRSDLLARDAARRCGEVVPETFSCANGDGPTGVSASELDIAGKPVKVLRTKQGFTIVIKSPNGDMQSYVRLRADEAESFVRLHGGSVDLGSLKKMTPDSVIKMSCSVSAGAGSASLPRQRVYSFSFADDLDRDCFVTEYQAAMRRDPRASRSIVPWNASCDVYATPQQLRVAQKIAGKYMAVSAGGGVTFVVKVRNEDDVASVKDNAPNRSTVKGTVADGVLLVTMPASNASGFASMLKQVGLSFKQSPADVSASNSPSSLQQRHDLDLSLPSPAHAQRLAASLMKISGARVTCEGARVKCSYGRQHGALVMGLAARAHGGGMRRGAVSAADFKPGQQVRNTAAKRKMIGVVVDKKTVSNLGGWSREAVDDDENVLVRYNGQGSATLVPKQYLVLMSRDVSAAADPFTDATKYAKQLQESPVYQWADHYSMAFMDPKKQDACKKVLSALKSAIRALTAFPIT